VLEITPCSKINQSIKLPGSKYIANRLIPMCALASSKSRLTNIVDNDDIQAAISGLKALGYQLQFNNGELLIFPRQQALTKPVLINTSHSGTFSRFVAAIAALEQHPVSIECSQKMATRPMKELFDALKELEVKVDTANNKLPAIITGAIKQRVCHVDAHRSSQFISSLIIAGAKAKQGIDIRLVGQQVSNSYVDMTVHWLHQLSVSVEKSESGYKIAANQTINGIELEIPGDAVSASYFMGLVGIAGGQIKIGSFDFDSLQGESKFYKVLEKMGMQFERQDNALVVSANKSLTAVDADMSEMPDVVQTLAVMACFAKGTTRIRNIAHLAFKESNRIKDTATELLKTGINVKFGEDFLEITGGVPQSASIETYDDHRMAMSMALLGAKTNGIIIKDPQVVNKSFPSYWKQMAQCGLKSSPAQ
jgi:3-phosphoshikimate 1-carboxyvinyltransferase